MATIGIDNNTGMSPISETSATAQHLMSGFVTYSPASAEQVYRLGAYIGGNIGDGSGIEIGVYDITSGAPGAPLVASGVKSVLTANALNGVDITPVNLVIGRVYAVAVRVISSTAVSLVRAFQTNACRDSTLTGASALGATWSDSAGLSQKYGIYAYTQSAATAPIISTGTPTGTTTPTPTLGFTTDTNSGTARFVVDSAANLSGVTAAQVLAGQKASGAAAAYATGTITVSSTSIADTLSAVLPLGEYTAAAAQDDGENLSAVLTWTFTVGPYMAAAETGDDVFAADGAAGLNGISETLRDTDTGAVLAEETGLIVTVRAASDSEATLYATAAGETDASGVLQFSSGDIGNPGDYVYLSVEKSDNSRVAMFRVQVKDLNSL